MSFSLANSQAPCPFHAYGWRPGIIASAAAVEECALCSWARDGHTMRRVCDVNQPRGCIPGCLNTSSLKTVEVHARRFEQWPHGPFAPHDWRKMLEAQPAQRKHPYQHGCHNEVVIAAECWRRQLPAAVEAFWLPRRLGVHTDTNLTLAQYKSFHRTYNLSSGRTRRPLVIFDEQSKRAPFSMEGYIPL